MSFYQVIRTQSFPTSILEPRTTPLFGEAITLRALIFPLVRHKQISSSPTVVSMCSSDPELSLINVLNTGGWSNDGRVYDTGFYSVIDFGI